MARGKIQIKKIENQTNRQVTYSKRRNGLFKKATELAVLCDASVSIIMISSSNKLHEQHSPGITPKEVYDKYQRVKEVDLWAKQYQKMQKDLQELNEINRGLQKDIRRRMGDCLEDLDINELRCLEDEMVNAVKVIRERKTKKIDNNIDTSKKKWRNCQEIHRSLLQEFDIPKEESQYGLVDNGEYNHVLGYNDDSRILALRLQPCQPNLHAGAGSGSCVTTYTLL
ncbi:floral homeotic protein DEFICIENS-like [Chenopodium quinoa]|uniref:floral homeotic protein DEFICIENS-like n=1 Tax=Chenopodium quinoa TaxID=63459 RepID=UPI000B791199|nr:floral homeotic protein DEFICIENS-like [Chenopodium quinoa]